MSGYLPPGVTQEDLDRHHAGDGNDEDGSCPECGGGVDEKCSPECPTQEDEYDPEDPDEEEL